MPRHRRSRRRPLAQVRAVPRRPTSAPCEHHFRHLRTPGQRGVAPRREGCRCGLDHGPYVLDGRQGELTSHLAALFPKYWLPDQYVFVEQVPRNSTGKFMKSKLREQYGDLLMPKL